MSTAESRRALIFGSRGARLTGWLIVALTVACYCLFRFTGPSPLQTNLLALLPQTEADPIAEHAVDSLASVLGSRAVMLVTSDDAQRAKQAAKRFGERLAASGAFGNVTVELPPFDATQISRFYAPFRFGLLTEADRAALSGGAPPLSALLAAHLFDPLRAGLATPLGDDPFGWFGHWLAGLPFGAPNVGIEDNMLVVHQKAATGVLVMATLRGSAYESNVQASVREAVTQAQAALRTFDPNVRVARAGAVFHADAARRSAERDMHWIGVVSACGIALLMLSIFRSPKLVLLGFASTALGIVCALAVTMRVFGELHLLTLVFGASLIGEAVDYSIQYFVLYLSAGRQWDARRGAREVRPALTVALATSLLGYAVLACLPFPALKQIACFAMVGIAMAFASVLSLLPALLVQGPRRPPQGLFTAAASVLARWRAAVGGKRAVACAALAVIVAVPGWLRLVSDDDIHLLVQRDPTLASEERQVREAIGIEDAARFFVVKGPTPEAVLERCEALGAELDGPLDGTRLAGWQSVSQFVPSAQRQAADRMLVTRRVFGEPAVLRATLSRAGFRDEVAGRYIEAFSRADARAVTIDGWLAAPWSQPYRHLWLGATVAAGAPPVYAAMIMPLGVKPNQLPALASLARTVPGVVFVDKAASVSHLFSVYRGNSRVWLAGALALVVALLACRYGVAGGIAVTAPVVLAIGIALAAFGYMGVPLTLFNWLALMLVLGVGINYAVFLREGASREDADIGAVWTGVALSAATTLLSFGLLGLSSMPVLRSFGATLAIGIAVSVLLAPMAMPAPARRRR